MFKVILPFFQKLTVTKVLITMYWIPSSSVSVNMCTGRASGSGKGGRLTSITLTTKDDWRWKTFLS